MGKKAKIEGKHVENSTMYIVVCYPQDWVCEKHDSEETYAALLITAPSFFDRHMSGSRWFLFKAYWRMQQS